MPSSIPAPQVPPFNLATRDQRLHELAGATLDVIVVGGGITGAGIARDAAMRGLRTALVERGDVASGTSQASSKLIHGGLRYLEHGKVGLVLQSVSERHRLRQLAPHLARPIPFLFPVYGRQPRPLWMIAAALWGYDGLAMFRSHRLHRTRGARRTAGLETALRTSGLDGSVAYWDCLTDDARLTLETARGAHDAGAAILTWSRLTGFVLHRSQVRGVEVLDRRTGQVHALQARVVVLATGPWTDRTLGLRGDRSRILRPTKGAHCMVARDRLPIRHVVCLFNPDDRRMLFAIPTGSRVLLGTTDTEFDGDFDDVRCDRADVEMLLQAANRYFPDARLGHNDVLGTYAGLRPLLDSATGGERGADLSREHSILVDPDGLVTVAGGKLTTYRAMAAEVLGVIAERLKSEAMHVGGCPTASVRLPGGLGIQPRGESFATLGPDGDEAERELREQLGPDVAEHLRETYGGVWPRVAERAAGDADLASRIVPGLPYIWAELDHAVEQELAFTPSDFLRRRTQLEIRDVRAAWEVAPRVAARMGALLGWSGEDEERHLARWQKQARRSVAWRHEGEDEGDGQADTQG